MTPRRRQPKQPKPGPPFEPCASCTGGWVARERYGVVRMVRCPCWHAHQAKLALPQSVEERA